MEQLPFFVLLTTKTVTFSEHSYHLKESSVAVK